MAPATVAQGTLGLPFDGVSPTHSRRGPKPNKPPVIAGLHYFPAFLDDQQQRDAIRHIDESPWLADLERRVQHYGWRYDYRARTVDRSMRIGPLPDWLAQIAKALHSITGLFETLPNQAIVNEYEPGQGIAMHVDRHCFGPTVATVSLADDWTMDFLPVGGGANGVEGKKAHLVLARGSVLVLTGPARHRWRHGIAKRKSEFVGLARRPRQRRLSLTFRTVRLANGV